MAPKIKVPIDFGVHLRSSPTHNTLKLNTSEGGEVLASSVILSFNSPVIDHMTTTLHMTSVDMLEFSEAAVQVFVNAAYSGTAEGINREIFRDINKMSNVFEVAWLMDICSEYFTEATNSIVTPSYSELLYLFDEACFVFENLKKKTFVEMTNDKINDLNWKEEFIKKYLENADRLSTKKLDMVIELAGSDVSFVIQSLANQLTEMFKIQGPSLPTSFKYLLDNIDLSVCVKSEASGFYQLFDLFQQLPSDKVLWSHSLLLETIKNGATKHTAACEPIPTHTSTAVARSNIIPNLYHDLDFNMNFDELLLWLSVSESVTSLLLAIEAVLTWNYRHYVNKISARVDLDRFKQKLIDIMISRCWSVLSFEFQTYPLRFYLRNPALDHIKGPVTRWTIFRNSHLFRLRLTRKNADYHGKMPCYFDKNFELYA